MTLGNEKKKKEKKSFFGFITTTIRFQQRSMASNVAYSKSIVSNIAARKLPVRRQTLYESVIICLTRFGLTGGIL